MNGLSRSAPLSVEAAASPPPAPVVAAVVGLSSRALWHPARGEATGGSAAHSASPSAWRGGLGGEDAVRELPLPVAAALLLPRGVPTSLRGLVGNPARACPRRLAVVEGMRAIIAASTLRGDGSLCGPALRSAKLDFSSMRSRACAGAACSI